MSPHNMFHITPAVHSAKAIGITMQNRSAYFKLFNFKAHFIQSQTLFRINYLSKQLLMSLSSSF